MFTWRKNKQILLKKIIYCWSAVHLDCFQFKSKFMQFMSHWVVLEIGICDNTKKVWHLKILGMKVLFRLYPFTCMYHIDICIHIVLEKDKKTQIICQIWPSFQNFISILQIIWPAWSCFYQLLVLAPLCLESSQCEWVGVERCWEYAIC